LFTNSNNINSLKVQIAGELAGQPLQIVGVAPNDRRVGLRNILPVLEVEGSRIFLPAPAAILVMQAAGKLSDKDIASYESLFEWESGTLYPLCLGFLQTAALNKNTDAAAKAQLFTALSTLGSWCA